LTITLKLDYLTAYTLIAASLLLGTPFFIFFGWLSDKIGRLKIILAGCLVAVLTYFSAVPGFDPLRQPGARVVRRQDADQRGGQQLQLHILVGPWSKFTDCDKAKDFLTKQGLSFKSTDSAAGEPLMVKDRRKELKGPWDEKAPRRR